MVHLDVAFLIHFWSLSHFHFHYLDSAKTLPKKQSNKNKQTALLQVASGEMYCNIRMMYSFTQSDFF